MELSMKTEVMRGVLGRSPWGTGFPRAKFQWMMDAPLDEDGFV